MKSVTTVALILAFSVCAPAIVYANTSVNEVEKAHSYHRVAHATIPSGATALSHTLLRERDTDGLSRDRDDCNMGCVDY
jgi:hypothetical protein